MKPEVTVLYNNGMKGVNLLDQLVGLSSTIKWYKMMQAEFEELVQGMLQ